MAAVSGGTHEFHSVRRRKSPWKLSSFLQQDKIKIKIAARRGLNLARV